MENTIQKYELDQNGKKYILSIQVEGEYLLLKCTESEILNPPLFIGNFALIHLQKLNPIFDKALSTIEAKEILNQTIENKKVSVDLEGNVLYITLYLTEKEDESGVNSIKIGLTSRGVTYNNPLVYQSIIQSETPTKQLPEKISTKIETVTYNKPIIYQSITHSQSPTKQLPPEIISTETKTEDKIIYSPVKRLPDSYVQLPPKETKIAPEIVTEITETNQTNQTYETNNNNKDIEKYFQNNENYLNYDYSNLKNETQVDTNLLNTIVNSTEEIITTSEEKLNTQNENQNEDYSKYFTDIQANTQTETQNEDYNKYFTDIQANIQTETQYETTEPYISQIVEQQQIENIISSPLREQIQYTIPDTPSTAKITYTSAPSHQSPTYIEHETSTITTQSYEPIRSTLNMDMSIYNQKIDDLQRETNKIKGEHDTLKNESKILSEEVGGLKRQIQMILEDNRVLRAKSSSNPSQVQTHEITTLKQENERLKKQLEKYIATESTFDQYKRLKEEEIKYLKLQIDALVKNQKKIEDIITMKKQENSQMRLKNESLALQQQQKKNDLGSMQNQILTIKDTHLEIVKGDIIKSSEELELLTRKICKNYKKVVLDLLYKATVDSDRASEFHKKCDWANRTLILIKSGNDKRFGGYTTCNWSGDSIDKKDENAFVFSLDKMKIYDIIPGEDAIGCYPKYGPVFLGCQIRIFDNFFSNGGTTFEKGMNYNTEEDYELSGGLNKFEVKEIEVYNVQLE